ncbi:hypothetical protein [Buttiauxella ferragutiae]|jgi:hypothetical protein|uniref:hypothetical protein n=1 Tax=Buttiauxella ferragutiae TaxID=82989 RepID=UPI001F53BE07|nr:hypothetical protein [Buttiauxella ferragutiae]UNK60963.1 hypothetical protein MNO13_21895 [Buttiauxella ferragutiae]
MEDRIIKVYIVCTPSFSRCFSPLMMQGNPLSPFIINPDDYIIALQNKVVSYHLPWDIIKDNTHADSNEILQQSPDIVLVTPGLKLMFARGDIPKNKIIHLDYFNYSTKNVDVAITDIKKVIHK